MTLTDPAMTSDEFIASLPVHDASVDSPPPSPHDRPITPDDDKWTPPSPSADLNFDATSTGDESEYQDAYEDAMAEANMIDDDDLYDSENQDDSGDVSN